MTICKRLITQILLFCSTVIFILSTPSYALAINSWREEFDSTPETWSEYANGGIININDSWLSLSSSSSSYPYLFKQLPLQLSNKFTGEIRFKYSSVTPWGTGIVLGDHAAPNNSNLNFMIQHDSDIAMIKIWQDWFGLQIRFHPIINENLADAVNIYSLPANTAAHVLQFQLENGVYSFQLDNLPSVHVSSTRTPPSFIAIGNPLFLDNKHP